MSYLHSSPADPGNRSALLLTLSNLEQAARHAAKVLLADAQSSRTNGLESLIAGIQRKADSLRVIHCGGVR